MSSEEPKTLTREEALAHFKVGLAKMVRHLERAGVLKKPTIRAEIIEVTTTSVAIQLTIPRMLVPDLIVLRPDDLIGFVNLNTADLTTGNLSPDNPLEAEDDAP